MTKKTKNRNLYREKQFKIISNLIKIGNVISMLSVNLTLSKLNKIYISLISSSILAGIGLIYGLTPNISVQSQSISFSINANAQQFSTEEIENYAKAGYEVELLRRRAYKEIKNLIDQPPPNIVCDRQETLENLDSQVREIADRYCNQSLQIVQQHNLSINRFNQLKTYYDRRDSFYQQVQNILLQLQN